MTDTPKKIAFQGAPGANSDIACREAYPDMQSLPCRTFADAFRAVQSGEAELAIPHPAVQFAPNGRGRVNLYLVQLGQHRRVGVFGAEDSHLVTLLTVFPAAAAAARQASHEGRACAFSCMPVWGASTPSPM